MRTQSPKGKQLKWRVVAMDQPKDALYLGNCLEILPRLPDESVDLIVTSPPYADRRKNTYGGVTPEQYVEWFLPITAELKRVLKPEGSFILNIKERVVDGERGTYVLELVLELRKQGWLWTEEYCWHKKNSYPGKWPNRFRDSWERCYHLTKQKNFKMVIAHGFEVSNPKLSLLARDDHKVMRLPRDYVFL